MSETRGNWVWNLLRRKKRSELDKIERQQVKRTGEERPFAGDPAQPEHLRIPLKKRPNWMK